MGGHFAIPLKGNGEWVKAVNHKNHTSDISPTGAQMPRLLGLAQASKIYRAHTTKNRDIFHEMETKLPGELLEMRAPVKESFLKR